MGFDGVDGVDFQRRIATRKVAIFILTRSQFSNNTSLSFFLFFIIVLLFIVSFFSLLHPSSRVFEYRFADTTKIKFSSSSLSPNVGTWQTWSTMEKEEEEEIGLLYISRSISASVPYLGSSNRIHIYARPSPVHRDSVNKLYISNGPETDLLASRTSKGSVLPAPCSRP